MESIDLAIYIESKNLLALFFVYFSNKFLESCIVQKDMKEETKKPIISTYLIHKNDSEKVDEISNKIFGY